MHVGWMIRPGQQAGKQGFLFQGDYNDSEDEELDDEGDISFDHLDAYVRMHRGGQRVAEACSALLGRKRQIERMGGRFPVDGG